MQSRNGGTGVSRIPEPEDVPIQGFLEGSVRSPNMHDGKVDYAEGWYQRTVWWGEVGGGDVRRGTERWLLWIDIKGG